MEMFHLNVPQMIASRLVNYYATRVRLCEGFGGCTLNWGVFGPDFLSDDFVGVFFKQKTGFFTKKIETVKSYKGHQNILPSLWDNLLKYYWKNISYFEKNIGFSNDWYSPTSQSNMKFFSIFRFFNDAFIDFFLKLRICRYFKKITHYCSNEIPSEIVEQRIQ